MIFTYEDLISKIQNNEPFSFARYGDGEFFAILGGGGKYNTDQHKYYKDMGMRLYKVIKSKPKYIMGLQPKAVRENTNPDFHELIAGIDWVNSDVLHNASKRTRLVELFDVLKQRNIIFVGNVNLVETTFKFINNVTSFNHIVISERNCWLEYKDILKRLRATITKDVVILYAASMGSEVLIDDIYNEYGDTVTQIDVGSAFDPYSGIKSRSYHHKL